MSSSPPATQPRHFHARAAPAPATWEEAERAALAAVPMRTDNFRTLFLRHLREHYPDVQANVDWDIVVRFYEHRSLGARIHMMNWICTFEPRIQAALIARIDTAHIHSILSQYVTERQTRAFAQHIRPLHDALRERTSTEEKRHLTERARIGQSNVVSYIEDALGDNVALARRVSAFLQPDLESDRELEYVQTRTRVIDRLRRLPGFTNPRATARQRADAIWRFSEGVYRAIEYMYMPNEWDGGDQCQRIMRYLTPVELARLLAFAVRIEPTRYYRPQTARDMTVLLSSAVHTLRQERAALAASGLIQWLARRDADAAMHLSTHMTRTVVPAAPHTYITTQPGELTRRLLKRLADHKRRADAATAVSSRTRQRTAAAAAQQEHKHDDE